MKGFPDMHPSITPARLEKAVRHSLFGATAPYGFCCKCGEEQTTEPDSAGVTCQSCKTPSVYGAEMLNLLNIAG